MYWYVSASKVDALANARQNPLRSVGLKLSAAGIASADVQLAFDPAEQRKLNRVRKRLDRDPDVRPADALTDHQSPIFSFEGIASRAIVNGQYWVAVASVPTAVLLVGSPANAIGGLPVTAIDFSPSADPIGALERGFGDDRERAERVSTSLSYAWQHVMRQAASGGAILPRVHGLAVFSGLYPATRSQVRRSGVDGVTHVAIGSPVYVEQR